MPSLSPISALLKPSSIASIICRLRSVRARCKTVSRSIVTRYTMTWRASAPFSQTGCLRAVITLKTKINRGLNCDWYSKQSARTTWHGAAPFPDRQSHPADLDGTVSGQAGPSEHRLLVSTCSGNATRPADVFSVRWHTLATAADWACREVCRVICSAICARKSVAQMLRFVVL